MLSQSLFTYLSPSFRWPCSTGRNQIPEQCAMRIFFCRSCWGWACCVCKLHSKSFTDLFKAFPHGLISPMLLLLKQKQDTPHCQLSICLDMLVLWHINLAPGFLQHIFQLDGSTHQCMSQHGHFIALDLEVEIGELFHHFRSQQQAWTISGTSAVYDHWNIDTLTCW